MMIIPVASTMLTDLPVWLDLWVFHHSHFDVQLALTEEQKITSSLKVFQMSKTAVYKARVGVSHF